MRKYHPGRPLSPDSKFMQAMSRGCDLLILNLIFLLSCVPIITVGAAVTAMYTVCFKFDTDWEEGVIKGFFRAFRSNFRQATGLWLILLLCGGTALVNILLFQMLPAPICYGYVLFILLSVIALLTGSYAFPLLSRFSNDNRSTLKNALALSIGFFPRSIVIAVVNAFPFVLLATDLYLFLTTGFIWIAIYFSAGAYISSLLLKPVFARFAPPEESSED